MTVWIVNPFDNLPIEGYRPQRYWLMARGFAAAGHRVVYWTSDFSHATKKRRVLVRENAETRIELRMVPTLAYPKNICLRRIASHWQLSRTWQRLAEKDAEKPDVVIASTPPLGLCSAARRFAADCGAVFVADVQDAWPETFARVLPGFAFSLLGMRRLAKKIYCEADGVSAVATRYVELARKYGSEAPISVFGHCIDMSVRPDRKVRDDRTLRLVYIGNMSMSYDLETVVNAVSGMDGVTLDVAGNGPDKERLRALASKAENIKFHGYLEESQLANLLSLCDIGLIPMFPESCVGVPGKLADYAAAGLRIVECLGGETRTLVECFHAGAHYEPRNVQSLVAALSQPPDAAWDPPAFAATFDAKRIMAEYVAWVESMA